MLPVSPVIPGAEEYECVLGADQPEYIPLPCLRIASDPGPVITRWRFTDEERLAIAGGADLVFTQLTFGHPFSPVHLQVTGRDELPVLMELHTEG